MENEQSVLIANTICFANVFEVVKNTMGKIGLEFIAPIEEAEQNEQISKSINQNWKGGEQ